MQKHRFTYRPFVEHLEDRSMMSVLGVIHEAQDAIRTLRDNQAQGNHDASDQLATFKSDLQDVINQTKADLKAVQDQLLVDTHNHDFAAVRVDLQNIRAISKDLAFERADMVKLNVLLARAHASIAIATATGISTIVQSQVNAIVHHLDTLTNPPASEVFMTQEDKIDAAHDTLNDKANAILDNADMLADDAHSHASSHLTSALRSRKPK